MSRAQRENSRKLVRRAHLAEQGHTTARGHREAACSVRLARSAAKSALRFLKRAKIALQEDTQQPRVQPVWLHAIHARLDAPVMSLVRIQVGSACSVKQGHSPRIALQNVSTVRLVSYKKITARHRAYHASQVSTSRTVASSNVKSVLNTSTQKTYEPLHVTSVSKESTPQCQGSNVV